MGDGGEADGLGGEEREEQQHGAMQTDTKPEEELPIKSGKVRGSWPRLRFVTIMCSRN